MPFSSLLATQPEAVASRASLALLAFLLAGGVIGWTIVARRRRLGLPPVEPRPGPPVPWDGRLALLSAAIYFLLVQLATPGLAAVVYQSNGERATPVVREAALADPDWIVAVFQAQSVTSIMALVVVVALLRNAASARFADLGIAWTKGARYALIGLAGFAVLVPTVILLQAALEALWMKSQHPIIVAYRASEDSRIFLWGTVAAVFVAPLVEEFFFRGVLQGWLQRNWAERARLLAAESTPIDVEDPPPAKNPAGDGGASWTPIVVSALLFALVHLPAGPDAIPIFFLALGLGYLYRQTRSIWPGVVVHTLLNAWSMLMLLLAPKLG